MDMVEAEEELVLPPTLAETKEAISALIGDITERRTWINLQYEGRRNGLRVDWALVKERQDEIAAIQGDIDALKKHASGFREQEALKLSERKIEQHRLKIERMEAQRLLQREAQAAKNDRKVSAALRQQARAETQYRAVLSYIAENLPDHLAIVRAVSDAAKLAFDAECKARTPTRAEAGTGEGGAD
jgi:hypothetical protein